MSGGGGESQVEVLLGVVEQLADRLEAAERQLASMAASLGAWRAARFEATSRRDMAQETDPQVIYAHAHVALLSTLLKKENPANPEKHARDVALARTAVADRLRKGELLEVPPVREDLRDDIDRLRKALAASA